MKIYLVGGAVRDKLLGLPVKDRDYVVVGATPEQMTAQGFKPVGADFPVFLHPETKEEYALARTERKSGRGYKGFTVYAAPDVTLEDDLRRRDLTINAMAEDETGRLVDPFHGADDLRHGVLRHVSPAFSEDPVRVLRVARFAARFADGTEARAARHDSRDGGGSAKQDARAEGGRGSGFADRGFRVADETAALMRDMVENGEVDHLVAERVWQELEGALGEKTPSRFFETLRACGALKRLFPELDRLYGVPQPQAHHPEIDTGVHTLMVLDAAAKLTSDTRVRFAALMHDLGKGTTPKSEWPRHIGHEQRGVALIRGLVQRFRIPNDYRDLAVLVASHHGVGHRAEELRPDTYLKILEALDVFRRPERLEQFVLACEADFRGRTGYAERDYPPAGLWRAAYQAARSVDTAALAGSGSGPEIAERLRQQRIAAIKAIIPNARSE